MNGGTAPGAAANGHGNGRRDARLPGEGEGSAPGSRGAGATPYHLLVERVHDYAISLMDPHGVITHWGEGAVRMAEYTPAEVVGQPLGFLYPAGGAEDGNPDGHLRYAAEHGEYIGEGTRTARDRGPFPARVVLTALHRDGELFGFSMVVQDLSRLRAVEEQLRQALRAAESANVEKSRFLATMSHEIRTPINAILGYADLLDLEVQGPMTEGQRQYLERVRASGRHLLALVEDVLDFARVEAGRLAVAPARASLARTAEAAIGLLRPQAEAQGLRLELECADEVEYWGDDTRVQQILVNLLGNAIKFTDAGGSIRLCCECAEPDRDAELHGPGPWTCARVEDTGIGIPADRLGAVFEPFVQVDNALTRAHQGSGLGLAISRRLARLMGGDLTVRSRAGKGSVFSLWLPAGAPQPQAGDGTVSRGQGSLTPVAQHLATSAAGVVRGYAERLRVDPGTPSARRHTRSELEDHLVTLVTDLAQVLVVLEEDGDDARGIAKDADDVQRLLAIRHGRQRCRLGWSEAEVRREYEILGEEIETSLNAARDVAASRAVDEALPVVRRLLNRAVSLSIGAYREDSQPSAN
ncbi:PAS domain-containing sensor histidine kinase [Longimicrobium sp.]|uniref:sensor histidine kinase n=1 Tax=Longimicrobium sp. TaxID=2029185 RepID=UPI002CFD5B2C|nr:ATP-binding protein [Longimicrobium sp.]HSU14691.1 ATP-binding protein [Longimicrobium sp.]